MITPVGLLAASIVHFEEGRHKHLDVRHFGLRQRKFRIDRSGNRFCRAVELRSLRAKHRLDVLCIVENLDGSGFRNFLEQGTRGFRGKILSAGRAMALPFLRHFEQDVPAVVAAQIVHANFHFLLLHLMKFIKKAPINTPFSADRCPMTI